MQKNLLRKIINSGIYLLIFLLPLQTHYLIKAGTINGQSWEFGNIILYAVDILLITIIIIWLANKNCEQLKNNKIISTLKWPILTLVVMTAVSIAVAPDKILAFYGLIRLVLAIALFVIISASNLNKKIIVTLLIASGAIQAIWGLTQFFTQSTFENKWLGLATHASSAAGSSVIEAVGPDGRLERWLRAYGTLPHPNILGGFLALALVLALAMIVQQINRTDISAEEKKKFNALDSFYHFSLIIISAGLFFTFSRSAILAAALGLAVIIIYNFRQWQKLLVPLIIICITASACYWHYGYLYQTRLSNDSRLEIKSTTERSDLIKQSLILIKQQPLTGQGVDNFGVTVHNKIDQKQNAFWYQPVHNVFLLITSEIGIIGLLAFLMILFVIIKNSYKGKNYLPHSLLLTLICLMTFDHYLWTQGFGIYLLWLGLSLATTQIDNLDNSQYSSDK